MSDETKKPGIRAQMLSDRQVDKIEGYQSKIRAVRDNYASFEVALAEAQRQLKATNEQIAKRRDELDTMEIETLESLESRKQGLGNQISALQTDKKNLSESCSKMHEELHAGVQSLQDKQKVVADKERDLTCGLADLKVKEKVVTDTHEAAIKREGELERIKENYEQIQAHTLEIEKRIEQKQAQLDTTLDEIKNNRLAEVEAKKAAEAAQKEADEARKQLIIAQQERNDLKQRQTDVETRYAHSVELFDGAKDLEQTNKVKEVALRNVEDKLNREKGQLRQAQDQLVKEVEAHRIQKETGGK